MLTSPKSLRAAAANTLHLLRRGGLADLCPTDSDTVTRVPRGAVLRYRPSPHVIPTGPPVLLVPPPCAPAAAAFDLRRGGSLAEHLVATGRRAYLLAPAHDTVPDLTAWARDTVPEAIRRASDDAGGQPVQVVGWSLGGAAAVLAAAARPDEPLASVTAVAVPVDPDGLRPRGAVAALTKGAEAALPETEQTRAHGLERYLTRPMTLLARLDDADFLAQAEAVRAFAASMENVTGRALTRACAAYLRRGGLASGVFRLGDRRVCLSDVRAPVLVIAGRGDTVAPLRAAHPLTRLLTGSAEVAFHTGPGGHLGVLSGRAARTRTWPRLDRWLDEGVRRHGLRAAREAALTP